mmetsp:Transcript_17526/g.26100  ORF Transcript_17526/g.26100 Transcript_17526/m.26100 type:complete len:151 (-) Transcript_17526:1140-1592(-)
MIASTFNDYFLNDMNTPHELITPQRTARISSVHCNSCPKYAIVINLFLADVIKNYHFLRHFLQTRSPLLFRNRAIQWLPQHPHVCPNAALLAFGGLSDLALFPIGFCSVGPIVAELSCALSFDPFLTFFSLKGAIEWSFDKTGKVGSRVI